MALRYGSRSQETLLPASIEEYVGEDDPVRVYDAFVAALDFTKLGIDESPDRVGNASYDPRSLLKLLVYGYSYGIRSSRKLERACHHNLSFIWLTGNLRPDHKTIANFRRRYGASLRLALRQCARLCLRLNLVEGNVLFVDGTKIGGNVSGRSVLSRKEVEKSLVAVSTRIEELLAECEQVDVREASGGSLVHLREELSSQEAVRGAIMETLKEFNERGVGYLSSSDKDALMVKDAKGYAMGYNSQVVTDEKHGLIVENNIVDSAADCNQLHGQVERASESLGKQCETVVADAGYDSFKSIRELDEKGVEVIVPDSRESQYASRDMNRDCFAFDKDTDSYICPAGHRLQLVRTNMRRRQKEYRIRKRGTCRRCVHWGTCTTSSQGRVVKRALDHQAIERVRANFQTARAQRLFSRRKIRAEHPFAHFKGVLGYQRFLLRGRGLAEGELSLMSLAYNLRRMWGIMSVKGLIRGIA